MKVFTASTIFLLGSAFSALLMYVASISKHLEGLWNETILIHFWFFLGAAIICFIIGYCIESLSMTRIKPFEQMNDDRPRWDSTHLIGDVHKRFMNLQQKKYDWRSFYAGWLEGRASMLAEIEKVTIEERPKLSGKMY